MAIDRFAFRLPKNVLGRANAGLHVHQVQQVLQDVEQLFEAQVRAAAVQVHAVPVRGIQGLHTACPSGPATLQGAIVLGRLNSTAAAASPNSIV